MATYVKIKEIKDKENKSIVQVLKYIAEKEGYMSGKDIQYKKLYYFFLRDKFLKTAKKCGVNDFTVSIKQYKRLRIYRKGKFSIHIAVYLLTLYEIMYNYKKKASIGNVVNDISYTTYIVNDLKNEIHRILMTGGVSPILQQIFQQIYSEFIDLDNKTGRRNNRIYNNIW